VPLPLHARSVTSASTHDECPDPFLCPLGSPLPTLQFQQCGHCRAGARLDISVCTAVAGACRLVLHSWQAESKKVQM
jgi:hypothetical protein